jgi:hypothetical protein
MGMCGSCKGFIPLGHWPLATLHALVQWLVGTCTFFSTLQEHYFIRTDYIHSHCMSKSIDLFHGSGVAAIVLLGKIPEIRTCALGGW